VIPKRLIRTVPEITDPQTEAWWEASVKLTPGWEHVTLRDPLQPGDFAITSPYWERCNSGAQKAGLIRLEALLSGGIYIDSDVEIWSDPTPLLDHRGFAAYEDANTIPDAILGFEPGHPVVMPMIREAIDRLPDGAWESGPGVTTRNLPGRDDVTILPTHFLYPYHWKPSMKRRYDIATPNGRRNLAALRASSQETFMAHYWRHSWA
jgi:mannosyltransferase OCH1-like enzyme